LVVLPTWLAERLWSGQKRGKRDNNAVDAILIQELLEPLRLSFFKRLTW
jgi:hypothetical protein